jgi:branched-subunit amino acid ABC-type transport system permease component
MPGLRARRGLAAVAAVLIVPIQQAHYLMGHDPLLLSFIVVIIGGLGSACAARWSRRC